MSFGPESTTEEVLGDIDLSGKRAIVTGAASGLGSETARALASRGASVTLAVRNLEAGEAVAETIRSSTGNANIDVGRVELAVPDSVRAFAKEWSANNKTLSLLVNNAGIMACPLDRTAEGWELQFATNHLGHFLLTCLLAPALRAGAPARVVNLSSGGHRLGPVDFDDPHFEKREYDKWLAYGSSKTANVLFSVGLSARLGAAGVHANAVHPGVIMTALARHLKQEDFETLQSKAPAGALKFKPVEAGAATSVWAATAPELEGRGGLYLEDCHVGEEASDEDSEDGYAAYALDAQAADQLWALSEKLVGQTFDFS